MSKFQEENLRLLAERQAELKSKEFPKEIEDSISAMWDLIHFMPMDPQFLETLKKDV